MTIGWTFTLSTPNPGQLAACITTFAEQWTGPFRVVAVDEARGAALIGIPHEGVDAGDARDALVSEIASAPRRPIPSLRIARTQPAAV